MIKAQHLDLILSALLVAFGAYVAYQGIGYGYLDEGTPGAGFFPFWIGIGLMLFSVINLVNQLRRAGELAGIDVGEMRRVGLTSLAMAGFVWLGSVIGMIAAAFLLMLAVGVVFGPRTRRFYISLVVFSVAMTAILYGVFGVLLAVPLL